MEDMYKDLPDLESVLKLADIEASSKGLKVFVFEKDDLDKMFTVKYNDLAVITIAGDIDKAKWNLNNHRHSYVAKIK